MVNSLTNHHRCFGVFVICLLLYIPLYLYSNDRVDKICITYLHLDGYATYRSMALYKLHGNYFKLDNLKETHNSNYLLDTFPESVVSNFLTELTPSNNDTCFAFHLSSNDIKEYKELVHNICSQKETQIFLVENISEKDYLKLSDDVLPNLSCQEISKALSTPCSLFYHDKPLMTISLGFPNGKTINISPSSCYIGFPWVVMDSDSFFYIDFEKALKFVSDIKFDRFVLFQNRSIMVLHVANKIIEDK